MGRAAWRAIFLLALATVLGCGPQEAQFRPNVLLITLDTTRADHLGAYGYEKPTSPNLDALAAESIVYDNAYSTSSWTLPAHASLFTGRYPSSHGAQHDPEGELVLSAAIDAPETIRARAMTGQRTLAQILGEAGYATGAVVAGPWMLRQFGLAAGFEFYDDEGIRTAVGRRAGAVTDRALEWLEEVPEPFLLFLNYFDPHAPYAPPLSYARSFLPAGMKPDPLSQNQAPALYDAEILYMDYEVGRLLRRLQEGGLYPRTLVVVTSDHGELFGEHGEWGHERFLWEPLVRVPLFVKPPGAPQPGRREAQRTSVVDVLPRILQETGLAAQPESRAGGAPVLAEVRPMSRERNTGIWRARWDGRFKTLVNDLGERYLFDLEADPEERANLLPGAESQAQRAEAALEEAFAALPAPPPAADPVPIDPETARALRALGYLESGEAEGSSQTRIEASE